MAEYVLNLYQAKTALSSLVDRAAAGEEIVIAKAGKPKAKLVPVHGTAKDSRPDIWRGRGWVSDDFDAPLPDDILAAFEGRETVPEEKEDRLLRDSHVFFWWT